MSSSLSMMSQPVVLGCADASTNHVTRRHVQRTWPPARPARSLSVAGTAHVHVVRIVRAVRVMASIGELPSVPAIYAMYGGEDRRYVAYVGIGDNLRRRVTQHLVNRNSSATTDTGAVRLHPDHISAVSWWEHPTFADRVELEAAELVAFDVLEPTMRSRGGITPAAKARAADKAFRYEMAAI